MPDINIIKQLIHEELSILVDLFYSMNNLKEFVLNNADIKDINNSVSKISENALKLAKIEKKRVEHFEQISKKENIKNSINSFYEYFSNVDLEVADLLKKMSDKFIDINSLSSTLKDLLKVKVEYNDILIKLFMEPKNNVPVYGKNGLYSKPVNQGKANWQG